MPPPPTRLPHDAASHCGAGSVMTEGGDRGHRRRQRSARRTGPRAPSRSPANHGGSSRPAPSPRSSAALSTSQRRRRRVIRRGGRGRLPATIEHPHPEALGPAGPPDASPPSRGPMNPAVASMVPPDAAAGSPTFVAPRAGFHIVDDAAPPPRRRRSRVSTCPRSRRTRVPFPRRADPSRSQEPLGPAEAANRTTRDQGSDFLAGGHRSSPPRHHPEPTSSARPAVAAGAAARRGARGRIASAAG